MTAPDGAPEPAFTVTEHTEIACLWFGERPGHSNVIAMLMRQAGGQWLGRVRLRVYRDARVFGSDDDKHVWTLTPDPGKPVAAAVADFDGIMRELLSDLGYQQTDRVELHTVGWPAFWERMRDKHYMQIGKPDDYTRKAGM